MCLRCVHYVLDVMSVVSTVRCVRRVRAMSVVTAVSVVFVVSAAGPLRGTLRGHLRDRCGFVARAIWKVGVAKEGKTPSTPLEMAHGQGGESFRTPTVIIGFNYIFGPSLMSIWSRPQDLNIAQNRPTARRKQRQRAKRSFSRLSRTRNKTESPK